MSAAQNLDREVCNTAPKSLILDIFNAGSLGGSNDCLLLSNFKSLFPLLLIFQLSVEPWVAVAAAALKAFGQDKGQIVHEAHFQTFVPNFSQSWFANCFFSPQLIRMTSGHKMQNRVEIVQGTTNKEEGRQ